MCSGSVWFTGLKCGNHFALLLQCIHCLEMFLTSSSFFFLFSFFLFLKLARPLLLCWQKGVVFVRGCIEYHFDGLLSQLLVALHL